MTVAKPEEPRAGRCAALLRGQAATQGWTLDQLADHIRDHCGHSRLRAKRLARGWTLDQLIRGVIDLTGRGQTLTPSRVSRWELGQDAPSAAYRDALCQIYRTGPVDLGFDQDYRGHAPDARSLALTSVAPVRGVLRQVDPGKGMREPAGDAAASTPADTLSLERVAMLRRQMDETLAGSTLSDATVAHKEKVAEQYGRVYKAQSVRLFLPNVLADFQEVQVLTDRRLPSSQRKDLSAVTARLAGLVSMSMVNLGEYREAREWTHTARLAADEAGDPELRAWVATRAAVAHLHFGDPTAATAAA